MIFGSGAQGMLTRRIDCGVGNPDFFGGLGCR